MAKDEVTEKAVKPILKMSQEVSPSLRVPLQKLNAVVSEGYYSSFSKIQLHPNGECLMDSENAGVPHGLGGHAFRLSPKYDWKLRTYKGRKFLVPAKKVE